MSDIPTWIIYFAGGSIIVGLFLICDKLIHIMAQEHEKRYFERQQNKLSRESHMESTHIQPRIFPRDCGGWLAVSPSHSPIKIGIAGTSEEDARVKYHESMAKWEAALVVERCGQN